MRLCCGLLGDLMLEGRLASQGAEAADGRMVVVLENEEVLLPEDVEFGEFSLVQATGEERAELPQAGYTIPDWNPSQAQGCPPSPGPAPSE